MRRAFEHPLAPALGCAIVCAVYLLAQPATADMAAHSYRAWLFQHEGLTVWNAQWYGGHHVLGYSLLFAPLAAAIGPALRRRALGGGRRGALRSRSRARRRRRRRRARRRRGCSTAGVLSQRRDRADAVPARDRARGRRVVGRGAASAASLSGVPGARARCWPSPVAGVFLLLGAAAKLLADGRPGAGARAAVARAARAWRAGSGSTCCSPRAGRTASRRPRSGRCS